MTLGFCPLSEKADIGEIFEFVDQVGSNGPPGGWTPSAGTTALGPKAAIGMVEF
jgi:hypothetical protein